MINEYVNQLICGDCIEVMKGIAPESVDAVITDPPYLVNYKSRDGRRIAGDVKSDWLLPAFKEAYRVLKNDSVCVSFYGWNKVDVFMEAWRGAGFQPVSHFVFVKSYASNEGYARYHHEQAYLLAKGTPPLPKRPPKSVILWGKYTYNRLHPTQKPVEALRPLITSYTRKGDIILDPFAGSGTTAAAAIGSGRRYIAIELDKKYHALARQRLQGLITNSLNQNQSMTNHKNGVSKPAFIAYKIIESADTAADDTWEECGQAWAHRDGKGYNLELPHPIGKIVLRSPRSNKKTEDAKSPALEATK